MNLGRGMLLLAVFLVGCSTGGTLDASTVSTCAEAGTIPDTWASYAGAFFQTYCTECHDAQDPTGRNFNIQANVEAEKLTIRCGVAVTQDPAWQCASAPIAKQFPIGNGPKPCDAERDRIVAWVTAGAP